jgi:hypothetical protein
MSLLNFIPQIWADTLLPQLRQDLVFGNLVNRDYEGSISGVGDTVKINGIGDITVSNYTKDTTIGAPQALSDAQTVLTITQAKYYNFAVDSVDAAQQKPKVMAEAMAWAAYKIALAIDQYIAGLYTEAPSTNLVGTSGAPVTVTTPISTNIGAGTTVYDELVSLSQFLTQSLVPRQGRWCVISPWMKTHLAQDPRFVSFNTAQAAANIQAYGFSAEGSQSSNNNHLSAGGPADAFLGMIENMAVYESVSAPHIGGTLGASGSQDAAIAGHPMAWTYADGVNEIVAYAPPDKFSDAIKGLHLYGAKVVRPYALAVAFLQKP